MELTQETKNLFRLTRFGMINCFLVREADGLTLIDTSLAGSASGIREAARTQGAPIRRIVLTHAHIDHVGSTDALIRELPDIEFVVGQRESRLLRQDFSLDAGETGKKLLGFPCVKSLPTRVLMDGDRVGSLQAIFSPGHTPGHMAYLDVRDGSLIAGDAFTTQMGVIAAGVFKFYFPFPALFSWNREYAAESAKKLRNLKPARLAVGHGKTIESPLAAMDRAIELAFRQCGKMLD
ncbi:MAG TPA: MBL fold metallo-hydrolase [Candidatus Acidoferrales bacterium]|nr:MBL fold metallo-hydrolase [Candidatus Acidoferrales bacterium]